MEASTTKYKKEKIMPPYHKGKKKSVKKPMKKGYKKGKK